jgi:UDP-GlcNAc:undecaprenyl-phosphate GlcNAc-1-phosphate transferase
MSQTVLFVLPGVMAALLSYLLGPLASRFAIWVGAVDLPGHRKIHATPIPRLGGLAVVAAIVAVLSGTYAFSGNQWQLPSHLAAPLSFGIIPIFIISLIDDIRPVAARKKFIAHALGASIAVALGVSLQPVVHLLGTPIYIGSLAGPLSVLWIVGVTNAFNIIDGLDGLSAGLALISAASMAAVFILVGEPLMAGTALVLAGALAGFLPYNSHPARMFLGDTGATAIGFCLSVFALKGGATLTSGFAALLPVFMLALPIAETLITMARRAVGRLETQAGGMFVPDRNHIHHRLLALGIEHGKAVLILYATGLLLAAGALISVFMNAHDAGLFLIALLVAGFVGVQRLGYDEFAFIRRGTVLKLYEIPAAKRGMFVVFVDIVLSAVAAYVAVGLKSDHWQLSLVRIAALQLATTFAPVTVLVFWWSGMYRGSWRVAGLVDFTKAFSAVVVATMIGAVVLTVVSTADYPTSLLAIYGIVTLILTVALRASYVVLETTRLRASHSGVPVLIYGAGVSGVAAGRGLFRDASAGLRPIGFIDDDVRKRGRLVCGLPVFGAGRELEAIIRTHGAQAVLLATSKLSAERIERASHTCRATGVSVLRLNVQVERLIDGVVSVHRDPVVQPLLALQDDANSPAIALAPLDVTTAETCPSCASQDISRSKARSLYERLRKAHTPKRLFRCGRCGWRGWLLPLDVLDHRVAEQVAALDLSSIDSTLAGEPRAAGAEHS